MEATVQFIAVFKQFSVLQKFKQSEFNGSAFLSPTVTYSTKTLSLLHFWITYSVALFHFHLKKEETLTFTFFTETLKQIRLCTAALFQSQRDKF